MYSENEIYLSENNLTWQTSCRQIDTTATPPMPPPSTFQSEAYKGYQQEKCEMETEEEVKKAVETIKKHPEYLADPENFKSVVLAIPYLGKGFQHLLGPPEGVGNILLALEACGFQRVVPFKSTDLVNPEENPEETYAAASVESLHSSRRTHTSSSSLTGSQKDILGINKSYKWPITSKTSLSSK